MKTLDNVKLVRGIKVWEVGITAKGEYIPTLSIFNKGLNDVTNTKRCWKDYKLCLIECNNIQIKEVEDFYKRLSKQA
tara:strand:- start:177 stop:407 length:231 start_codon:yes stop_codon:yes gene_type:complete